MSLQVWLPLNGDLHNQGLSNYNISMLKGSAIFDNNGKIGKCFHANGVNTIKIENIIPDFYSYSGYSLCVWFYIESQNTSHSGSGIISAGNWNNQILNLALSDWSTDHYTRLQVSGTSWNKIYNYTFNKNTWYHVVVSSDGNKTYAYVNGVLIGNTVAGFLPTSIEGNNIAIGGATYYSGMQFFGKINDVRIYDHALSAKEVEEIAKGLVLHYKLDQPANINYNLYIGSKNFTGTWVNRAAWTTDNNTYNGFTVKRKSSVWGGLAQNITATNGDIFTISFWGKVDSGGNILSIHRSSLGNVTTGLTILDGNFSSSTDWVNTGEDGTQWKRYWATLQITSTDITYLQWRIENSVAGKNLYVAGMTLEKGYGTKNWSLSASEAGTTNIVYDSSGYSNNGTIVGSLETIAPSPRYSCATKFDGNTSCIKIPYNEINPDRIFTVNLWFHKDALGSKNYETLFGGPSGFEMDTRSGASTTLSLYMASVRGGNVFSSFNLNEWYMVTMVRDGTNEMYYINGELKKTIEAKSMPSGQYRIGAWASDTGQNYYGDISDFRIYATALTPEQIKELYNTSMSIDDKGNIHVRELVEL